MILQVYKLKEIFNCTMSLITQFFKICKFDINIRLIPVQSWIC